MAEERRNIYTAAPGFKGLNTQDSPVTQDPSFASVADNAVIDKFGRVAARKGLNVQTSDVSALGSSRGIEAVFEFIDESGNKTVFSAGNNKIFTGTSTLSEVTLPGGYSISANNWKIISFNNETYFFQKGHAPLKSSDGSTTLTTFTAPQANEVVAAFGRLFVGDVTGDRHTLSFSDLLDGDDFSSGSSGTLDLFTVFPEGNFNF